MASNLLELRKAAGYRNAGITDTSPEHLAAVAERACTPDGTMRNMPIAVTPALVIDALRAADAYGRRQREQTDAIQLT